MDPLKVLFLGNSYTFFNDMPSMIAQLATFAGEERPFEFGMVVPGGVTLEWHSSSQETLDAIREQAWTYVVLQEQSMRPVEATALMHHYGAELDREIKAHGAQTVLYVTWTRQHLPEMLSGLVEAYTGLAKKIDATMAPVGVAWGKALAVEPTLVLHCEDRSHPTVLGSYLAACVFYATFYGASPVGLTGEVRVEGKVVRFPEATARLLQCAAWEAVIEENKFG